MLKGEVDVQKKAPKKSKSGGTRVAQLPDESATKQKQKKTSKSKAPDDDESYEAKNTRTKRKKKT